MSLTEGLRRSLKAPLLQQIPASRANSAAMAKIAPRSRNAQANAGPSRRRQRLRRGRARGSLGRTPGLTVGAIHEGAKLRRGVANVGTDRIGGARGIAGDKRGDQRLMVPDADPDIALT